MCQMQKVCNFRSYFCDGDGQITVFSLGEARIESARAWKAPAGKPHYVKY